MRIGILADSHDNLPNMERAVKIFNEEDVELIFHAGDYIAPFTLFPFENLEKAKVFGVLGNNDGEKILLNSVFSKIGALVDSAYIGEAGGKRIFMQHTHYAPLELFGTGRFDIIIYGHTHDLDIRRENSEIIINPGESCGWLRKKSTTVICDTETLNTEVYRLEK